MKYTRLIYMSGIVLMLLSACSDSSSLDAEGQNGKPLQQTFTVAVESVDDAFDFHKDNVINGMNPRTDYDCALAESAVNDAFSVYEIDLCKWFPGNTENMLLPLDMNDDGYLDSADMNWQTDEEAYPKGTISLPRGTVFGDSFWVSVVMTQRDVEEGIPTFQMQMLDAEGRVIKYWDIILYCCPIKSI